MNKQANINLILSMTLVSILVLVSLSGFVMGKSLGAGMDGAQKEIERLSGNGEIGDVEGYGIIAYGVGYGLSSLGMAVVLFFVVLVPAFLAAFIFIFSLLARLVYKNTKGRVIAYRILMGFSFAGQLAMLILSLIGFTSYKMGMVVYVMICAFIIWAIVIGIRGTYSYRLTMDGKEGGIETI